MIKYCEHCGKPTRRIKGQEHCPRCKLHIHLKKYADKDTLFLLVTIFQLYGLPDDKRGQSGTVNFFLWFNIPNCIAQKVKQIMEKLSFVEFVKIMPEGEDVFHILKAGEDEQEEK